MSGKQYRMPRNALLVGVILASMIALPALADDRVLVVGEKAFADSFDTYAQVQPIQVINVQALVSGQVEDLRVLPGQHVRAGEVLARLSGIARASQSAGAAAAVAQARAAVALARRNYAATRKTYPDISTRQQLAAALSALTDARARLTAAQARHALVQGGGSVTAPVAGTVLNLDATTGQALSAGSTLLVLQPDHGLWLKAAFYGNASQRVVAGMTGKFLPADGSATVPVRVRSVINEVGSDGGRSVGCVPIGRVDWSAGEAGTLVLQRGTETWPALPSEALILDAGRWWVVIRKDGRYRNQIVRLGPQHAGWTAITEGIKAGDHVVIAQAYRIYHRDFARNYQPPD